MVVYDYSKVFKVKVTKLCMAKKEKKVYECKCERCGHSWITRSEELPIVCPKCKSPYWNKPYQNQEKKK